MEISIEEFFFGERGLVTDDLDPVGEEISWRASFTGDKLMLETSRLPELVLDIIEEFIEDMPEVSTELVGRYRALHSIDDAIDVSRSVIEPAKELLWSAVTRSRDLDLPPRRR